MQNDLSQYLIQHPEVAIGIGVVLAIIFALFGLWISTTKRKKKIEKLPGPEARIPVPQPAEEREKVPAKVPVPPIPEIAKKRGIANLLTKTQEAFTSKLDALLLSTKTFDNAFIDNLEELLYTSDLGPVTVEKLLVSVREKLTRGELHDLKVVKGALFNEVNQILTRADERTVTYAKVGNGQGAPLFKPWVILVVGVNGVGKTTSIGKLARHFSERNKKVLIVAGDTFRAAAEQQLAVWGARAQVEVYTTEQTKDPAAVAFQGIQKGVADGVDVVIVDTAGRLHNKEGLMEELKKVKRVAHKALESAPNEVILVIDANSGQNAKVQAQQFNEALGLTSLIVTKLDGTAKGGVIVSIAEEVGVGPQFLGTGEKITDLEPFSSQEYARELLDYH